MSLAQSLATPVWTPSVQTIPIAGESPRGYLIRCCERNGWPSLQSFLRPLMITAAEFERSQDVERMAAAFDIPVEAMAVIASPIFAERAMFGEEALARKRLRRIERCICESCLQENRFLRHWWELDFVTNCPIHGEPLKNKCGCGKPLTWADSNLTLCRSCQSVVCYLPASGASADQGEFESYALARIGVLPRGEPCVLDAAPLATVLEFVEAVGSLLGAGYAPHRPALSRFENQIELREKAFSLIVTGKLGEAFVPVANQHQIETGRLTPKTPVECLGWFADTISKLERVQAIGQLVRDGLSAALGFPVYDLYECDYVHVETVARDAGLSIRQVLRKLLANGQRHRCYASEQGLFVPIDLAWELGGSN